MADKSKQADTSSTTSKDAPLKSAAELDKRAALRKAEAELFQRLAKVVQPIAPEPDEDERR